jgi:XTP/dITP diphosphohydrolase
VPDCGNYLNSLIFRKIDVERRKLVFSSFNTGKRSEVAALLSDIDIEVLSPADIGLKTLPEETGLTFVENAVIKALAAATASGLMAVGDDSGLEVDALCGRPGVHSARYAGVEHDDSANNLKLLSELVGVSNRRARFVCTTAMIIPSDVVVRASALLLPEAVQLLPDSVTEPLGVPVGWTVFCTTGYVEGVIIDDARGTDGFGYDPIFYREDLGRTFAQMTTDEKNLLSHRGQAFARLRELLKLL